jgi:hypothetical protein
MDSAREVWREGLRIAQPRLDAYPDHKFLNLLVAELHVLLGDDVPSSQYPVPCGFPLVFGAYLVVRHGPEHQVELLSQCRQLGVYVTFAENQLRLWGEEEFLSTPQYAEYARKASKAAERLREQY